MLAGAALQWSDFAMRLSPAQSMLHPACRIHAVTALLGDKLVITLSISRYSSASSADMNLSRSVSLLDLLERTARVVEQDSIEPILGPLVFGGVNQNVLGRAFHAGRRLVDHDPAIWQRVAFALGSRREQHSAHRSTLAHAVGGHVARYELHRVVDRHACGHAAAGRVDVQMDVGLRVIRLQEQQLCDEALATSSFTAEPSITMRSFSRRL